MTLYSKSHLDGVFEQAKKRENAHAAGFSETNAPPYYSTINENMAYQQGKALRESSTQNNQKTIFFGPPISLKDLFLKTVKILTFSAVALRSLSAFNSNSKSTIVEEREKFDLVTPDNSVTSGPVRKFRDMRPH